MAATCDDSVQKLICDKFNIATLRDTQIKSLNAYLSGKDVFLGTKTGSGKSLLYESIPLIKSGSCVLVIAPLITIMAEQCERLQSFGFKATYIGQDTNENEDIEQGKYDFVFGSPERLIGDQKWREMLKSEVYQRHLECIVVDEAHTVIQWGESTKKTEEPFRKLFSRIGELRSLCPKVQMIALTGTSGPTQRRRIVKVLCLRDNTEIIYESPDRANIKISSLRIPNNNELDNTFEFLINELKEKQNICPRYVIFCEAIKDVSKIYACFVKHFGRESHLYNMYHAETKEHIKSRIQKDMAIEGNIRILICTNSAGMGVNFHNLNNIIHYGLPKSMDTFVQQMGRAGRDRSFSNELIIYKCHKGQLKDIESDLVKLAKDDSTCRRSMLCSSYCVSLNTVLPKHNCCDVCAKNCCCGSQICPRNHVAFTRTDIGTDENTMQRNVSVEQREYLKSKLNALKFKLSDIGAGMLVQSTILHGLCDDVIDTICMKCHVLFTADDIMETCAVWSFDIAGEICAIINNMFGDEEMYSIATDDESD